ncbi:unnamed protein product, partial [Polarella glacialis]
VVPELSLKSYEGTWYEVASQNLGVLSACSCSTYHFAMTSDRTFDDRFTCTKGGNPSGVEMTLKGRIPDLSEAAKMVESPVFSWMPSAPYWVVEVGKDYEYAVVYACVPVLGEYIYVFHRHPEAISKRMIDLNSIQSRLTTMGIDASQVKIVPHPASCQYPAHAASAAVIV